MTAFFQIVLQCSLHLLTEIDDSLVAAFAQDSDTVVSEIDIPDIQADALRNADARSEQQRQDSHIPYFGSLMEAFLSLGQPRSFLHLIQKDDLFLMEFG